MIIPIGHEQSSVRRIPWVSAAILLLCVGTFLWIHYAVPPPQQTFTPSGALAEAADLWRDRAYLDAAPEVLAEVGRDVPPAQREQYLALLREMAVDLAPLDPDALAAEQAELDRLTDLALGRALPDPTRGGEALHPFYRWGLVPARPSVATFVTHLFLHAGWMHLIGNMLLFFLAGPPIEDRWGRPLFAAFYLGAGLFAAGFFSLFHLGSTVPLVGASGAVSGLLGAFLVLYARTRVRFFYFFWIGFRVLTGTFRAPALAMIPLWFANEVLQAWLWHRSGATGGVAYLAHVGGFVFGAGGALAVRALRLEERFIHDRIESQVTRMEANPALEEAFALREQGDLQGALAVLQRSAREHPDDADLVLALWDAAVECRQPEAAAPAAARLVRAQAAAGEPGLAARTWVELSNLVPAQRVDTATLLKLLPAVAASEPPSKQAELLRSAADPQSPGWTPGNALRIFDLARQLDPPTALLAAQGVLANADLDPAKRERLAARAAELEAAGHAVAALPGAREEATASAPAGVAEAEDALEIDDDELAELAAGPRFSALKVAEARLTRLEGDRLQLVTGDGRAGGLAAHRIGAVAVAAVRELGPRPVLVVDLLLNWSALDEPALRAVRLRSDRLDLRRLAPDATTGADALRALVADLLAASGATPLPDASAAAGRPFRTFERLADYQREVLDVAEG